MNNPAHRHSGDTEALLDALRKENAQLKESLAKATDAPAPLAGKPATGSVRCDAWQEMDTSSQDELCTIFKLSQVGILLIDGNRRVIRANPRSAEMFGYDNPKKMIGKSAAQGHISPEDYEAFDAFYRTTLYEKGVIRLEHEFKRKDGSVFWASITGKAVDPASPPDLDKGVIWILDDITRSRRQRKSLELAHAELELAHAELESFFTNSMVGILVLRGGRYIYRINQRMADILRYPSPEDLAGKCVSLIHLSEDNFENFGKHFYDSLVAGDVLQVEYPLRRSDGSSVMVEISGKAIDTAVPPDLNKGVIWICADITRRKEAEQRLRDMANIDPLTGVFNRRHFMELGQRELSILKRHDRPLTLLMLDIDHFKAINDTFGHAMGDKALMHFTATCRNAMRTEDILGRLGGEEFAIFLPDTRIAEARMVAERIRLAIQDTGPANDDTLPPLTVSIGMAAAHGDEDMPSLMHRADTALYAAKESGRNRVETANDPYLDS